MGNFRIFGFIIAAAATAAAGLLFRRLVLQAGGPASLPSGEQGFAVAPAEPLADGRRSVSPGALRSASRSLPGTREELYRQAAELGVKGRSRMNKRQLHEALEARGRAKS